MAFFDEQPGAIDLTPPEDIVKNPQDLVLYLFQNFSLLKAIAGLPTIHAVATTPFTIADNAAPSNIHIVHWSIGNSILNLPSNPNPGELFIIKDMNGLAGVQPKQYQVTGLTGTIDGFATRSLVISYDFDIVYGYQGNYFVIG